METRFGEDRQIIRKRIELKASRTQSLGSWRLTATCRIPITNSGRRLHSTRRSTIQDTDFCKAWGRLKPNVTVEQARADLQNIEEQIKRENTSWGRGLAVKVMSLREHRFGDLDRPLMILLGAVVLVLLVACVNVANLMFGRATERWKEMALRSALGASRLSLVRMLLVESAMLAAASGGLGLLLANYGVNALAAINPAALPTNEKMTTDGYVIAFTSVVMG